MPLTDKTKFDFWILFAPRAGSHMLASALDSHPEIQCGTECWTGETRFKHVLATEEKRVKGTTVIPDTVGRMHGKPDKIILLLRDPETLGAYKNHKSFEDYEVVPDYEKAAFKQERHWFAQKQREASGIAFRSDLPLLILYYDMLTQNKDCRELPKSQSDVICDFLGVKRHPLRPLFYKPKIKGAK